MKFNGQEIKVQSKTFNKKINEALVELNKTIRKERFDKGLPIYYMNKDSWLVEEWADGTINKIKDLNNDRDIRDSGYPKGSQEDTREV